jgi:hypothetical protein
MDQKTQRRLLVDRYRRGENIDISALSEPLQTRLRQERTDREAMHAAYERTQAEAAKLREAELEAAYLAAGGSAADWQREKAGILARDREQRTLDGAGSRPSLVDLRSI